MDSSTPSPQLASLFDLARLLSYWNVLLIVAIWTIIQTTRRALPSLLADGKPLAKLLPLAPLIGCCIAVWIPGPWLEADDSAGQRIVLGVVLGALTANFHNIASKLGLHGFLRMEPDPVKRVERAHKVAAKSSPPAPESA